VADTHDLPTFKKDIASVSATSAAYCRFLLLWKQFHLFDPPSQQLTSWRVFAGDSWVGQGYLFRGR
jgi:hypothetical protein